LDEDFVSESRGMIDPLAQAFPTPALRKVREGRGTRCFADAGQIKSLGHPPLEVLPCFLEG